jgi:5-methylcytosine-specific restriction endonuclease McrA
MRSLPAPVRDAPGDLRHCASRVKSERRPVIQSRLEDVLAQYVKYVAGQGRPDVVEKSREWPEGPQYYALYEFLSDRRALAALRLELRMAANGRCLLCSNRSVDGLDHHLPRSEYPALSILPVNLVPACARCNTLKGNDCDAPIARQFVHPYFDNLPQDKSWLTCEAFDAAGVWSPVFSIDDTSIPDPETRERIAWQFDTLKLADEYHEASVKHVAGRLRAWSTTVRDGGVGTLIRQLELEMMSEADENGASYWKAVVLRGILADHRFRIAPLPLFGNPAPFPGDWR